jgi:LacI family transcriptional regulator
VTLPHNSDRSTTLHEVAALAGVSTATAARALGDYGSVGAVTRERVLLAAAKLGYRRNELASSLITGRTFSIGLVLGDIENPFFSSIARTIIDAAKSHAYAVLVTNTEESVEAERAAVRVLEEKRVDGMIVAPVLSIHSAHLAEVVSRGTPVVVVNGTVPDLDADCIIGDNVTGAGEAVDYLLSMGHRDIAILARSLGVHGAPMRDETPQSGFERIYGYRQSLERAGVPCRLEYQRGGGLRVEDATVAMGTLLDLDPPPTAVVTTNSVIVLGALRALHARGLSAPQDVSLINFDDPPWAEHTAPPLTTVAQPTRRMGEMAVDLLLQRINNPNHRTKEHRLATKMHIRGSVRRLA